jgi:enoyl-CoA hydratase
MGAADLILSTMIVEPFAESTCCAHRKRSRFVFNSENLSSHALPSLCAALRLRWRTLSSRPPFTLSHLTMTSNLLTYELSNGVATLTMDDGKANVMSVRLLQAIDAALDRAVADKAVVVLTGRAGMFSGGFDMAVFKGERQELARMLEAGARLSLRLLSHPFPVVAVCAGHAMAMGAFLLLSTDLRIGVSEGYKVQLTEVQIGMTLPHFAIEVSRQRLTPSHYNLAAGLSQPYTPQGAMAAGFLDEIVPADALASTVAAHTARLQKLHMAAFAATKLRLRANALTALRDAIDQDVREWSAPLNA